MNRILKVRAGEWQEHENYIKHEANTDSDDDFSFRFSFSLLLHGEILKLLASTLQVSSSSEATDAGKQALADTVWQIMSYRFSLSRFERALPI